MYDREITLLAPVDIDNPEAYEAAKNDKELFIKLRRNGFGASDSSIILGVNPYETLPELLAKKMSAVVTEEELAVGDKENVRKGADLEPLILSKASEFFGREVYKPESQYRLRACPQLTTNFDGIMRISDMLIPVEAKYVSSFANKYWNRQAAIDKPSDRGYIPPSVPIQDMKQYILKCAEKCGIPPYYYTQVQQQMLALNAPFGYLAALFDKGWQLLVFKVYKDQNICDSLECKSAEAWKVIKGGQ